MLKSPNTRSRVPKVSNKHGHEFEGLCHAAFNPLEKKYPIKWERIIDSRAAGNIIRDAEGDFRLKINERQLAGLSYDFVIECKASVVENSFNRCFRSLIGSNQLALMRKAVEELNTRKTRGASAAVSEATTPGFDADGLSTLPVGSAAGSVAGSAVSSAAVSTTSASASRSDKSNIRSRYSANGRAASVVF